MVRNLRDNTVAAFQVLRDSNEFIFARLVLVKIDSITMSKIY